MKRAFSMLLALVLLLVLLSGCGQSEDTAASPEPEPVELAEPSELPAAQALAEAVLPASGKEEGLEVEGLNRDVDAERLAAYIEVICGLAADRWEDAAVIRGTGASAFEIVVLRLADEDAAAGLETVLAEYLTAREGAFTGYAPAEAEMAANGLVRREERTVGLFICPDPEGAAAAFAAAYHGEALPAPVEAEPEPVEEQEEFTPLFEIHDLLHRLLLEAACPEWGSGLEKAWTNGTATNEIKYGIAPDQYAEFVLGNWGTHTFTIPDIYTPEVLFQENQYEVAIFRANSEDGAAELVKALDSYRIKRAEQLRTEEDDTLAEVWENGRAIFSGRYAALIVSDYMEDAVLLFPRIVNDPETKGYFGRYINGSQPPKLMDPDYPDRVRFTPPNEEDMSLYDTSAILAAWKARDPSALAGDDREIYDAAEAVLAEIMRDGMTDLEKETAAYGWLTDNVDYDWTLQDALAETDRRSYGPYGGLVNRAAVCLGFAASFQLLMDMSGVECITVVGACFNSTGDHAWNMVKLNGEWYCVDVTWDANGREQMGADYAWRYFNVTSDEMGKNHQWDYAGTPEAAAEDRGGAGIGQ